MKKRKTISNVLSYYIKILIIFLFLFMIMVYFITNFLAGDKKEYKLEMKKFKSVYLLYEFEGEIVNIKREARMYFLYLKNIKEKNKIKNEDGYFYKQINDSIFRIVYGGEILRTFDYHLPLEVGGYVYKNKNSTAVFYKYKGQIYLLYDKFCLDFSVIDFYSEEKYQYPCDSTIHKVTNDGYWWYIIRDTVK